MFQKVETITMRQLAAALAAKEGAIAVLVCEPEAVLAAATWARTLLIP